MKNQQGSTLVVALILLVVITFAAVYSLESSNIQSKMVANSIFSNLTYQECRNEQESQVRLYNSQGAVGLDQLFGLELLTTNIDEYGREIGKVMHQSDAITEDALNPNPPKSDINITWRSLSTGRGSFLGGYSSGTTSQTEEILFENDCISSFRFSTNSQTLGLTAQKLKVVGQTD